MHDDAGLQHLTTLQQLEVLRVPCDSPHAIARLAAQLPQLRSLALQLSAAECCAKARARWRCPPRQR